jgi:hypothetical protein
MEEASKKGRAKYGDRLLGLIDKCLALEAGERPSSINECLIPLQADRDHRFRELILNISWKMVQHFSNWAEPNDGLNVTELVAFMLTFPAIDLSWRIGKGLPDKATAARLLRSLSPEFVAQCLNFYTDKGFSAGCRPLNIIFVLGCIDGYAATYLLDRRQKEWRYEMTCKLLAENCISTAADVPGFVSLMEDVIDRARGRVKKDLQKGCLPPDRRRLGEGSRQSGR